MCEFRTFVLWCDDQQRIYWWKKSEFFFFRFFVESRDEMILCWFWFWFWIELKRKEKKWCVWWFNPKKRPNFKERFYVCFEEIFDEYKGVRYILKEKKRVLLCKKEEREWFVFFVDVFFFWFWIFVFFFFKTKKFIWKRKGEIWKKKRKGWDSKRKPSFFFYKKF